MDESSCVNYLCQSYESYYVYRASAHLLSLNGLISVTKIETDVKEVDKIFEKKTIHVVVIYMAANKSFKSLAEALHETLSQ